MRILAITNLFPSPLFPHRGAFNRQQFRALAARNEVRVIAPISWTEERAALKRGSAPIAANRQSICDGLPVFHPRYVFPPRFFRGIYGRCFLRSIESAFSQMARDFQPEVILAAWAYPDGWAAVQFGRRLGVPVAVKVHGSDILTLADIPGRQKGTRQAMQQADAVIAVSRDLAQKVADMGARPENISVIYDGIDCERFCPGPREDARKNISYSAPSPLLLFIGNLLPVKGVDLLIEACAMLKSRGQDFRCLMIGDGPHNSTLQAQIAANTLTQNVQLLGSIPHARLPDYFRAADVFILPSRSEGVPCVLLEAAAPPDAVRRALPASAVFPKSPISTPASSSPRKTQPPSPTPLFPSWRGIAAPARHIPSATMMPPAKSKPFCTPSFQKNRREIPPPRRWPRLSFPDFPELVPFP